MEKLDNRLRIGILACLGGFATGLASCHLINVMCKRRRRDEVVTANWKFGELLFAGGNEFTKHEGANFSDITALVGSVSDIQVSMVNHYHEMNSVL